MPKNDYMFIILPNAKFLHLEVAHPFVHCKSIFDICGILTFLQEVSLYINDFWHYISRFNCA